MVLPAAVGRQPGVLYHFSEDPGIDTFEPRPGRAIEGRPAGERLVWAIDELHAPMYFFPRECPRIVLWAVDNSLAEDIARWLGPSSATIAIHVESRWLEAMRSCELYRYSFDPAPFETINDHGTHVSASAVKPRAVEALGDLESALESSGVELRVVDSLQALADAWFSTLHFSGIRLRNAVEWTAPV